jgi:MFS family permease
MINPVLRQRSFRRLLAALTVSQLGDWLYNVALLALIYDRTQSATWVSVTTAARVVPIVVLGPIGGLLADRFDRRLIMIGSDAVRAATMIGLAAVAVWHLPVVLAPALAALATAAASPHPACAAATLPRLVAREQLQAANAIRAAVGPLAIIAGPALGALLLVLGDATLAFEINAATFVASAALTAAISQPEVFRPPAQPEEQQGWWPAVTAGAQELLRHRGAAKLVGADIMCSLVYGVETVLLVLLSRKLGWQDAGYGLLLTGTGLGGLIGTVVIGRLIRKVGQSRAIVLSLLLVSASLPLLAVTPMLGAAMLLTALNGAGAIIVEVCAETALQTELPEEVFARAYGFAFPASVAGIVVGSLIAAPAAQLLGLTGTLTVTCALVAGYATWLSATSSRPKARDLTGVPGLVPAV